MEMLNKAFEDADAYKKMMEEIERKTPSKDSYGAPMNRQQRRDHSRSLKQKGNLNKVR